MRYLNVTTDFLKSKVKEEIYITLPKGIVLLEGNLRVCSGNPVCQRLLKSLYSLKQASLNWFERLENFLSSIGLQKLRSEPGIYLLRRTNNQDRKAVPA